MAARKRRNGGRAADSSQTAKPRGRRPNRTASVHLTVTPEHEARLRGLAVLLRIDASELVMDLVEQATAGMHFYIPGGPGLSVGPAKGDGGEADAA
jgi:hypothetical protein